MNRDIKHFILLPFVIGMVLGIITLVRNKGLDEQSKDDIISGQLEDIQAYQDTVARLRSLLRVCIPIGRTLP